MPSLNFFAAVNKTLAISLVSLNLTQKQYTTITTTTTTINPTERRKYQDVQVELLQQQIKFHPDQLKSAQENEAKRFCFVLTLWPPAKVKVRKSAENGRSQWCP